MELTDLRREFTQQVTILGRSLATRWEEELRRTSPVDTGLMRSRTEVRETVGANSVTVTAVIDTPYAEMVSTGTRPHKITAKNASVLSFVWHGKRVYFRSVNHPGTRPNPWWTDSLRDLPRWAQDIWSRL